MRINRVVLVVLGALVMTGCGDQFWCGEDGCRGKRIASASTVHVGVRNGSFPEQFFEERYAAAFSGMIHSLWKGWQADWKGNAKAYS